MPSLWVTPEELEDQSSSPFAYEACKTASFLLWALSGRKYNGTRTVTERYDCACRARPMYPASNSTLAFDSLFSGSINDRCGCSGTVAGTHTRLRLRGRPVQAVERVVSGSRTLDPSEYQVVNSTILQPAPGASFDVCGLEVTYTYGTVPPAAGRRAARFFARELTKSFSGAECELPDRVTSVSRQGVSYTILDNQSFIDDLRTGVYAVDLFLKAVNPDKARKPARVFSPDLPKASRITVNAPVPVGPHDLLVTPGAPFTWTVPLITINGGLLAETAAWAPSGQITNWNGALLLDAGSDRFTVENGLLSMTLTPTETGTISLVGNGLWDLYAVSKTDNYSVVHIMSSTVHLVSQ